MSVTVHVKAFKPADDKWKQMKTVYDACKAAGIDPPATCEKFFGYSAPDANGVEVAEKELLACGAATHWSGNECDGFEVDVSKLPNDVTVVRVYVSY